jgi:hypothetical protein
MASRPFPRADNESNIDDDDAEIDKLIELNPIPDYYQKNDCNAIGMESQPSRRVTLTPVSGSSTPSPIRPRRYTNLGKKT